MSRKPRNTTKNYIVFCEGNTEKNYIDGMRKKQGVKMSLKPVNMNGGGYNKFLEVISSESDTNCLAKFIIIDYDRVLTVPGEKENLNLIIDFCINKNKNGRIPYFLIIDNPDFEYVACLHTVCYKEQNTKKYIEKELGFKDLGKFKAYKNIYNYLNSNGNSFSSAIVKLKEKSTYIKNNYSIIKKEFSIKINKVIVNKYTDTVNGSNFYELFEVIDW